MAITGEEIRQRLIEFVERWRNYGGSERAEAQAFLNELFACFNTRRQDVARFEDSQHGRFLDLIWDRVCIVEMKRPVRLAISTGTDRRYSGLAGRGKCRCQHHQLDQGSGRRRAAANSR